MDKLRIGIFGTGRGADLAKNFVNLDCEIVAFCDSHLKRRAHGFKKFGTEAAQYDNFDEFIQHDMDAVILANYFHEHAPYAIKCLEKGIHVYSECISNGTMAEGVELIRAAEKSSAIYMLAENYPQMIFNAEIQRICQGGTLGKIMYAEAEYNHPRDPGATNYLVGCRYFEKHWRNYTPATYYITHALGPVMKATGATPVKVTAFPIFMPEMGDFPTAEHNGDRTAIVMTLNDDGSVFRVTPPSRFGAHHNSTRVCGTEGQIENIRGMSEKIMLRYNTWSVPEGKEDCNLYTARWKDKDADIIAKSGHGGSDYLTARIFVESIRNGVRPPFPFDVHSAVTMASVAILGHRSVLYGKTYDIPDFHKEECIKQYENDRLTPYYGPDGSEPTLPCCSRPDFKPTDEQLKLYREFMESVTGEKAPAK